MPECKRIIGYKQRCGKKSHLAPIVFYDPISMVATTMHPCQIHRDEIVRPIMKPYHDLENLIKIAEDSKNKSSQRGDFAKYEINFDPEVITELGRLYNARKKLTKYSCWLPDCEHQKRLLYRKRWKNGSETKIEVSELEKTVFTAFSMGQNGRNATEIRLHEQCFNKLKRKLGDMNLEKPIIADLTNF